MRALTLHDGMGNAVQDGTQNSLLAFGTAVPGSVGGYQQGCLFCDTDSGASYVNIGTAASANFQKILTEGATSTAQTITTLTATTANITTLNPTNIVRTGRAFKLGNGAKVGTTSGWTVGAANNLGTIGTVAASQSASTLVVPVIGVNIGDTITGFRVVASINSAGGTVTLDADLRKLVVAAGAAATDSSVATLTQVSVTAATASNTTKTGLTEVVAAGTRYYILLTATTAGSTTIELDDLELTVTTS